MAARAYGDKTFQVVTRDRTAQWAAPQPIGSGADVGDVELAMNPRGDAALVWSTRESGVMAAHRTAGNPFGKTRRVKPGEAVALGDSP